MGLVGMILRQLLPVTKQIMKTVDADRAKGVWAKRKSLVEILGISLSWLNLSLKWFKSAGTPTSALSPLAIAAQNSDAPRTVLTIAKIKKYVM